VEPHSNRPAPAERVARAALPLTSADEPEEWAYAWARLSTFTPGDTRETCPHCNEAWQYAGSVLLEAGGCTTILHRFRHAHHPRIGRAYVELIPASPAFQRRHGCGARRRR
jgi:hypothetical protein